MRQSIAIACILAALSGGAWALDSPARPAATRQAAIHREAHRRSRAEKRPAARRRGERGKAIPENKLAAQNKPASAKPRAGTPAIPASSVSASSVSASSVSAAASPEARLGPTEPQTVPPLPATLINRPPVKPVVQMKHGLLTIDAPNCTLADILSGVAAATGATIEGVPATQRVAVRLGPGDARAVIAALLRGTPYGYIILGSATDPHAVTRIVLSQSQPGSATITRHPAPAPPPQRIAPAPRMDENSPFLTPHEVPRVPPTIPAAQPPLPNKKPRPTTPEELFRQLQHLQQPTQNKQP